jgi:LuxR family maltose regulon positive regulatory protein
MSVSPVQLPGPGIEPSRRAAKLDVVPGKLRVPAPRPGSVTRTALVNRLRAAHAIPVVSVVAPAGYGKTTLLAQWVERDKRPCAWISVDDRDNDPVVLVRSLAAALDRIAPLEGSVVEALRRPGRSVWAKLVPRLAQTVASFPTPPIIVLDDVARIVSRSSLEVVAAIADQLPPDSTLVLSSRTQPELPIATLRADGRLFEVGTEMLALNRREADILLTATGIDLSGERAAELLEQTEGWAAGLYLAALSLQAEGGFDATAELTFAGDDRSLADYLRAEYLTAVSGERLEFLRRTSILDRMSGPLADAVLERTGSASELEELELANIFLVPLDRHREWFRYHRLFRDLLRHDLELHDAESIPLLHARAAAWYEAHDDHASAVPHLIAAGELDSALELVAPLILPACESGRIDEAEQWLARFDEQQLEHHPPLAVRSAWVQLLRGHEAKTLRHLALAQSGLDEAPAIRPWIAAIRAALCRLGVDQMAEDARTAVSELPEDSGFGPTALALEGIAQVVHGDIDAADTTLQRAAALAIQREAPTALAAALAQRALIATHLEDHDRAQLLAREALDVAPTAGSIGNGALELALSARALLRLGRWDEANAELAAAEKKRSGILLPWLAVQTDVELAWARITLRDLEAARRSIAAARETLRLHPNLGVLEDRVAAAARAAAADETRGHPARLTGAELRLLPLLATHLSFREIGTLFFVSRNTVKTQAISVYRKLGVSGRSAAIERAVQLGLIDDGGSSPSAAPNTVPVR